MERLPTADASYTRLAPCLMLTGRYPAQVYGRGSGRIREELQQQYYCPFAFESAFVSLENSDLTIEMERFFIWRRTKLFGMLRVYGEKSSFEWQQLESEMPVLYSRTGALERSSTYDFDGDTERYSRGSEILEQRVSIPDYADRLPKEIAMFTKNTVYNAKNTHLSFTQGGGHGGSHPPSRT